VQWDQRRAGRTFATNGAADVTREKFIAHGIELTEQILDPQGAVRVDSLKQRYKDKGDTQPRSPLSIPSASRTRRTSISISASRVRSAKTWMPRTRPDSTAWGTRIRPTARPRRDEHISCLDWSIGGDGSSRNRNQVQDPLYIIQGHDDLLAPTEVDRRERALASSSVSTIRFARNYLSPDRREVIW